MPRCRPESPCGGMLVEDGEHYTHVARFGGPRMFRCFGAGHTHLVPAPTREPAPKPRELLAVVWRCCTRCGEAIFGVPVARQGMGRRLHDVCRVVCNGGHRYCVVCRHRLPEGSQATVCAGCEGEAARRRRGDQVTAAEGR